MLYRNVGIVTFYALKTMVYQTRKYGAVTSGSAFNDLIMQVNVNISLGKRQTFAVIINDPRGVSSKTKAILTKMGPTTTTHLATLVTRLRQATAEISQVYNFGFNLQATPEVPIAQTIVSAEVKQSNAFTTKFNIQATVDFVGTTYMVLNMPTIDIPLMCKDASVKQSYIGAWKNDLVPLIIDNISLQSKAASFELLSFSGHDIWIWMMLFSGANKKMNDYLMGADEFEIKYSQFALNANHPGIAAYSSFTFADGDLHKSQDMNKFTPHSGTGDNAVNASYGGAVNADTPNQLFILDQTMDQEEFVNYYRSNLWYEAPVIRNISPRHSIHSHRSVHEAFQLTIPCDFLPFGSCLAQSIATRALGSEACSIDITIKSNWLENAFYLIDHDSIKHSVPLQQHYHDATTGAVTMIHDPTITSPVDTAADVGSIENVIRPQGFTSLSGLNVVEPLNIKSGNVVNTNYTNASKVAYNSKDAADSLNLTACMTTISSVFRNQVALIPVPQVTCYQTGYSTLPNILELLSSNPQILITSDMKDETLEANTQSINLTNTTFIQGMTFTIIPRDKYGVNNNGIPSYTIEAHHLINSEQPVCEGLSIANMIGSGLTSYSWEMLNKINPRQVGLAPLNYNTGLIAFGPAITPNSPPPCIYDFGTSGYITVNIFESPTNGSGLLNIRGNAQMIITTLGITAICILAGQITRLLW